MDYENLFSVEILNKLTELKNKGVENEILDNAIKFYTEKVQKGK